MTWKETLANKMIDGWFTRYIHKNKFDNLTEYDKTRFLRFARKFFSVTIGIANFIGLFLILTIVKNNSDFQTAILVGITILIISNEARER